MTYLKSHSPGDPKPRGPLMHHVLLPQSIKLQPCLIYKDPQRSCLILAKVHFFLKDLLHEYDCLHDPECRS